jgi:CheY-like chemotaxis protein
MTELALEPAALETPILARETPLQILLVEDSAADSEYLLALLEDELPLSQIAVSVDLTDALTRLSGRHVDVIIADLSLPDAEGLTVVHALRAANPDTPLLVLTGRADGQLALWALAGGAHSAGPPN